MPNNAGGEMREIKFRARHKETGEWYYGSSLIVDINQGDDHNLTLSLFWLQVEKGWLDSETVGQYTGLKDKNGKEIYKEDIVEYPETSYPLIVRWDDLTSSYFLEEIQSGGAESMPYKDSVRQYCAVIGNIYENKELLDAKKDSIAKG